MFQKMHIQTTQQQLIAMANRIMLNSNVVNHRKEDEFSYIIARDEDGNTIEIKWYEGIVKSIENMTRNERYYTSYLAG